jgi:hypothetical protein
MKKVKMQNEINLTVKAFTFCILTFELIIDSNFKIKNQMAAGL